MVKVELPKASWDVFMQYVFDSLEWEPNILAAAVYDEIAEQVYGQEY